MRSVTRVAAVLVAPALAALAMMPLATTHAASSAGASPNASFDAALPDTKPPPYPPKFDAGKPKFDAAADAKKDALPPVVDAPKPIPPDPTPLVTGAVFVLTVKYDKGVVSIAKARREKLPKKGAVERHFGRFAAELYSGPTLVERVRFDFPLINDDSKTAEAYENGLTVAVEVKIPDSDRPNKLEIWDRATDKRWTFDYPPKP
jgi:hypothetical protein